MKRATLTSYPTNQPSHPADLTDRLLSRESAQPASPARKRRAGRARPPSAEASADASIPAKPAEQPPEPPASDAAAFGAAAQSAAAPDALAEGLAAAAAAVEALRSASGEAPARYDVALRYRLDALAHHLQQVKEFVASLASR